MNGLSKKNILSLVFAGVFLGSLIVSGLSFFFYKYHCRHVFYFESYDSNKICTESRYYIKQSDEDNIRLFVADLLLGPVTNRFKYLFSPGTKAEFCFIDKNELYVGLSKNALYVNSETFNIKKSVGLLRDNIVNNFTYINKIYIYIDGEIVFEGN